jgi:hypothetical protein
LSIRDELWYPYSDWLKTKRQTRLLMKVDLLHFIRLQFLNRHILIPCKSRGCGTTMTAFSWDVC